MPAYNTYVGARYVPIFDGDWDNTKKYDPLTIVMHQGDSYTSKTYVPVGADITNQTFWAKTGNYNAQVAQLAEEVEEVKNGRYYVTPEMFGAAGDGITPDNVPLNNCFAFAGANGLSVCGKGVYLVDGSTETIANHYGVLVPKPVRCYGMRFKLSSIAPAMTTILTCVYGDDDYIFEDCEFYMTPGGYHSGQEDGGNFAILFIKDKMFPSDWQTGFGNITINNCQFKNIWTYALFITPIDSKLTITNCYFSGYTYAVLTYTTDALIDNCHFDRITGRNFGYHMCIDEIENFNTPSLHKTITIRDTTTNGAGVYNIQSRAMGGLVYDSVLIDNCSSKNLPDIAQKDFLTVWGSGPLENLCTVNNYRIQNCITEGRFSFHGLNNTAFIFNSKIDEIFTRCKDLHIDTCEIKYLNQKIDNLLEIENSTFIPWSTSLPCIRSNPSFYASDDHTTATEMIFLTNNKLDLTRGPEGCNTEFSQPLRFKECHINGFSFIGHSDTNRIINNYGIKDYDIDSKLFGTSIILPYPVGQYENVVDGVKTVVISGVGPAGAFKVGRYTNRAIDNLWYS